jgi:alpha-1,3-glucosyltransferase
MSLLLTFIGCLFSLLLVFFYNKKNQKNLKKLTILSFFICSMSFYLFSFHVHEKTILVPLLPFMIISSIKLMRSISTSFFIVSLFSLFPLLKRENQEITYIILMIFIYFYGKICEFFYKKNNEKMLQKNCKKVNILITLLESIEFIDIIFIIGYHSCELNFSPPVKYPWFYPLINASFSFINFICFYFLANFKMFLIYRKEI